MSPDQVIGEVVPPQAVKNITDQGGAAGLATIFSNIIVIIFTLASIAFVFMVVFSAFQWIVSGGDKERVSQARSRLTYAVIGIILLSVSFLVLRIIGDVTGFRFVNQGLTPPSCDPLVNPFC